jgi:GNAT superfamily N-acetyltransferase
LIHIGGRNASRAATEAVRQRPAFACASLPMTGCGRVPFSAATIDTNYVRARGLRAFDHASIWSSRDLITRITTEDRGPRHVTVRRMMPVDVEDVVETLVQSHGDYVWEQWALPFPDREERLDALFRADIKLVGLVCGEVWMTSDAASVAVWLMHDAESLLEPHDRQIRERIERDAFGSRHDAIEAVNHVIFKQKADVAASWHLATMGTRPDRQREGLGSAVLRPMLERLDKARQIASLETSSPENVAFYETLGFRVFHHVTELPFGAPPTWIMTREPNVRHIELPDVVPAGITLSV